MIEEDLEQSKEEGYEEPSCSASGICNRNDVDDLYILAYGLSLRKKHTCINGQMLNGRNSKEPF